MYLVPIAWLYVVLMVALVEALSPNGTVLGALATVVFYGLLPLAVLMYVLGTPARRRARAAAEAAEAATAAVAVTPSGDDAPHGRGVPAGDAVAAERKEA